MTPRSTLRSALVVSLAATTAFGCSGALDADPASDPVGGADGTPAASGPKADQSSPTELPESVTTRGATFRGTIDAGETIRLPLESVAGDAVALRFDRAGDSDWTPAMTIRVTGEETYPIAQSEADADSGARIPERESEFEIGYAFWRADTYTLELTNRASQSGRFRFVLTCRSGPCWGESHDTDGDEISDARDNCPFVANPEQSDPDGDGLGETCEEDGGAFGELEDDALEEKMRLDHRSHVGLDYKAARRALFGEIDNRDGVVEGIYTGDTIETDTIPNPNEFNTEHAWPKSRGAEHGLPKSDLLHLFPTRYDSNQARANHRFGVVEETTDWSGGGSRLGTDGEGNTVFEVRPRFRGDVARASFYFAAVYDKEIPEREEAVLRDWHAADPVDDAERARNAAIDRHQNSRNRFVDYPDLVGQISDF